MKIIKELGCWISAFLLAFFIINVFCFIYNRSLGWIDRDKGSTLGIWYPNKYLVHGTEGYSIYKVDERGYINDNKPLDNEYILVVGSSYTQGKEVIKGNRFTDILNDKLSSTKQKIKVYNVSQDSYYFPDISSGFKALNEEFPNAKSIIIEIANTKFSDAILADSLNFRQYDSNQNGNEILEHISIKSKAKLFIKNYFPYLTNLINQFELYRGNNSINNNYISLDYYEENINKIFEQYRSVYDGEIIIMYHPQVELSKDGNLKIIKEETVQMFENCCEKYNIKFVDMSSTFIKQYEEKKVLPYGFSNTTLGVGHFNCEGHKMVANELYFYLREEEN